MKDKLTVCIVALKSYKRISQHFIAFALFYKLMTSHTSRHT